MLSFVTLEDISWSGGGLGIQLGERERRENWSDIWLETLEMQKGLMDHGKKPGDSLHLKTIPLTGFTKSNQSPITDFPSFVTGNRPGMTKI